MVARLEYETVSPAAAGPWARASFRINPIQLKGRVRLDAIDLLRGLVMVLMVLDHTRDFFAAGNFNPRDVNDPALFLTRWVTHFCAPVFVFLAGTSAFLYGARGRTVREVSWFLFTRGLLLVLLELTIVRFAWTFSVFPDFVLLQVIWAIGMSMIVLSALIHLPLCAIGAIGVGMIAGHNLLDGVQAEQFGQLGWLWNVLHQPALLHPTAEVTVFALYPLIPWIGVMAAGYALGPVMLREPSSRRRWLVGLGIGVTLSFILLRATNLYGDPAPWTSHEGIVATLLSFVNTEKYPPSALYLAMTLGPALLALAAFEFAHGKVAEAVHNLRPSASLFLPRAPAAPPCNGSGLRGDRSWRCRLAVRWPADRGQACWLRAGAPRRVPGVDDRGGDALPALPLVCRSQAPAQRCVAELLLIMAANRRKAAASRCGTCAAPAPGLPKAQRPLRSVGRSRPAALWARGPVAPRRP